MSCKSTEAIAPALDRLRSLDKVQLQREWQLLYRAAPPRLSRDLLVLGLGYRIQEQQFGGLGRGTQRALRAMAASLQATGKVQPGPQLSLKPGTRFLREWQGHTHLVTVVAGGYEHNGATYKSLSTIAKNITGAHWSGPRFFGVAKPSRTSRADPASNG